MAKKSYTEQELEAILNSFDGIEKANPRPYLYTRIMARMHEADDSVWSRLFQFVTRPAFAVGITLIFLLINAYILFNQYSRSSEQVEDSTQIVALEYNSLTATIYDNNAETP